MLKFSGTNATYAVLPAGEHGHLGEAEIAVCRANTPEGGPLYKPWDLENGEPKAGAKPAIELTVKVDHETLGTLRVTKWMDCPTSPEDRVGGTYKTFAALGVSKEQLEGGFEPTSLEGTKVVVVVSNTPAKDDPNKIYANMKGISLKE